MALASNADAAKAFDERVLPACDFFNEHSVEVRLSILPASDQNCKGFILLGAATGQLQ